MRRSWIYSGLGSFLVTLTLLLTIFFPIFTKQHPVSAADETDYVDGFTEDVVGWLEAGSSPYLDSVEGSNYISAALSGIDEYWFTFGDTSESGSGYTVTLYAYILGGDGADDLNIYIDTTGDNTPEFTEIIDNPSGAGYSWYNTGTIAGLDTTAEYNSCRAWFERSAAGTAMRIDAAYIRLQSSYTWVNRAPVVSNWGPANQSKNIPLYNRTSALVSDKDGNESLICMWYAPPSATFGSASSWTKAQQNGTSDPPTVNGTVRDMNSSWITTYGYYYWWKVTAKDESINSTNGTKWFRTRFHNVTNSPSANETPVNAATGQDLNPRLTVYTNETITRGYNVTFRTNASGTWTTIGTNTSVTNGTHRWTPTTMVHYNTKYWWSVNSTGFGSKTWDNDTYYFTTKNTAPTASDPSPANGSSSAAAPTTAITVNTGGDSHSLTVTFFNNSSAAPTTWTNYGHNNSVGNGTYRQPAPWATSDACYWKVTVYDAFDPMHGNENITYWYHFDVSSLSVSDPFPVNNSQHVLTGIGNLSVIINSDGDWNISLRDNATYTLQAYATGASSSDAVQYCDVTDALYFNFNKDYTWYVNVTDGAGTWDNNTYYFTTFNGSGFIYLDNISVNTDINMSTGISINETGKYVFVLDNETNKLAAYTYRNSTLEFIDDIDVSIVGKTTQAIYIVDSKSYIHIGALIDMGGGQYATELLAYSFDGNSLSFEANYVIAMSASATGTKFYDMQTISNGTDDRVIYAVSVSDGYDIRCNNFDGTTYTEEDIYPDSAYVIPYYKLAVIEDSSPYLCIVNGTTADIVLLLYNESGDFDFNYKDTYVGSYNDVSTDGHYFYGVSDASLDIFSINIDEELVLEYSYIDSGISVISIGDESFIGSSDGSILSYLFEGGEFIEQTLEDMINNSGNVYMMDGSGSYLLIAGEEGGIHLYGYELLHVAPPVIDLKIAGNPSKDSVDRDGTIRYVNQSYNNETFCNITAEITVPDYRTIGRYFRTIDDTLLVATGNLSDSDHISWANETNQTFLASKYPCTFTGDYSQISAWIAFAGHGLAKIAYAIYSDNAGEPDSLLGFTEYKIPGESSGASYEPDVNHIWYTLNVSYDADGDPVDYITLNQGTDYWLVVATNDTSQYIEDVYWILGNSLGDTSYVRNATYTIGGDMNFSNVTSLSWSTDATEDAHYLCIYAIANSTYNDNINTVDIASATVQFYNGTWEEHDMTSYGDNLWTVNLTGLVDDSIWHTFNITAYDELNDEVTYNHYRLLYQGWDNGWDAENIEFKTGVTTVHESDHLGYDSSNVSTDLYNSSYVLYLYEHFYDDTPDLFGDGEHNEHVLPHEQGVDGGANDTGRWVNELPDDDLQQRYCYDFSGGFWDANISIEDTLTLHNVYLHWWVGLSGHTYEYDRDAVDFGRSNTTYDPSWLDVIGGDYYMENFPTNSSTKETSTITGKDIDTNDDHESLICLYYNMSDYLGSTVFDGASIYQFFIGHADNQSAYEWGYSSAIYNNRSYLSYVLFNIPPDVLSGVDTRDSDDDGLTDHYELNVSFTHPFLKDTDADGYDDNLDAEPNNYLEWERFWDVLDSSINGSIWNQTISWKVITSSINGSIYNQTSTWTVLSSVINGSFHNLTNWIVLDSTVNGSLYNLSLWNVVSNTVNGTLWNQTISWKVIASTINGTIYNNTGMWTVVSSIINGSIWNQSSQWHILSATLNGSIYNASAWDVISSTINGSIWNQTISWKDIDTTLNGTLYNNTGTWTVLSSTVNGSVYNTSVWAVISSSINGSISNTSWVWQAFSTTLNGSIYNNTGVWTIFSSTVNGSIYNRSATWSILSSTLNGSIYNMSSWDAFSTSLNGSIYNNTGTWRDFDLNLNGSVYNLSQWFIISSSVNGSIYNLSVWSVFSDSLNGSVYNISSWDAFDTTVNGSIWNTTSSWGVFSSTLNGSIYNMSGVWSAINADINGTINNASRWSAFSTSLNGSIYNNTGIWTIIDNAINGSVYNTTSWTLIDNTINGTLYNLSVWKIFDTSINGSIYNRTGWTGIDTTLNGSIWNQTGTWDIINNTFNGSIFNASSWYIVHNTINGSIYNTTVWTILHNTNNGSIHNTSHWNTINNSINGSVYNLSIWHLVDDTINGTLYNISSWNAFNTSMNGTLYNLSSWKMFNNSINGSIYNTSSYGWGPVSTVINGSIWNQTPSWTLITADINGTIYNQSSWYIISNSINGSIYNATVWTILNNGINGTFYNQSYWVLINTANNGTVYNLSSWTVFNNTINGSLHNISQWSAFNISINGSIYNLSTYGWTPFSITINGSIHNTSLWTTIDNTINGSIYNISVFTEINDTTNGSIYNIAYWQQIDITIKLNGAIYNQSTYVIINNTNNGSIYNTSSWIIIDASINGTIFNSSSWHITNNTINGTIYNYSIWKIITSDINGSIYNYTIWTVINNTINGRIINTSTGIYVSIFYPANESTGVPRNVTFHIVLNHTEGRPMNITWQRDTSTVYLGSTNNIYNGTYYMFSGAGLANHLYNWTVNISDGTTWDNHTLWFVTSNLGAGSTIIGGGGGNRTNTFFILGVAFGLIGSIFLFGRRRKKKRQRR